MGNHYTTLGVAADADQGELRAAYLRLARKYHPDGVSPAGRARAEARMQAINEAWNVVGVAHRREQYDASRTAAPAANATAPGPTQEPTDEPQRGHAHFRPFDYEPVYQGSWETVDLDPTPLHGSKGVPRWISLMPIVLLIVGALMFGLGLMVDAASILGAALVMAALGGVGFLALPLIVMSRAEKDPNL